MNKANKIDARYSVAQAIQRNWQGYLRSLNKQQFFGIVRKGHYLSIFKELTTRMVQQNAWVVLLFNGKVGDVNIYSVILVTNSYGESWDSSCEKYWVPVQKHWVPNIKIIQVCNWKCFGLCVTRQLIWLISLTDSKTLYYCSTKSKSEQIYAFLFYNSFQHEAFLLTMMVWQCCHQIYSIHSMLLAFPKQR